MIRWIVQLAVEDGGSAQRVDAALRDLPGHAGRNLPGSVGGGDATWEVLADRDPTDALEGTPLRCADVVALTPVAHDETVTAPPLIKRVLLLRVRDGVADDERRQFEAELLGMPRHIPAIRTWSLSHVDQERTPSPWTHAWEQEYASLDGLRVDYMNSPYHYAGVDRWFDPEIPQCSVEQRLMHVFYERS